MSCCTDPFLQQHFVGHKASITSLAFSPSGKHLASSSLDNSFMNWDLTSSKGSLRYQAKSAPVTFVTFSPNGNLIASCQNQFVRIWMSTIQGKSIEFKAHTSTVRSVKFSPCGQNILTASDDKNIKIWRTVRRKFVSSLTAHTNWVKHATYSVNGKLIVSCSDDKTVRLWDPVSSKLMHTFNEIGAVPQQVEFHPSGSCLGVVMSNNSAKIYDLRMLKLLQYYPCHDGCVNSLSFHPNGKYLLTGSNDKTCKIIDLIEGRAILSLEAHSNAVTAVSFSYSGDHFATASADKNVFVWKTNLQFDRENTDLCKEKEQVIAPAQIKSILKNKEYSAQDYEYEILEKEISDESLLEFSKNLMDNPETEDPEEQKHIADLVKSYLNGAGDNLQPIEKSLETLLQSVNALDSRMTEIEEKIATLEAMKERLKTAEPKTDFTTYK